MLVNLKIINHTDMELLFGKMAINMLGSGKMVKAMETELKYGKMEESISEHLKMTNWKEKVACITPMVVNTWENL